MMSQSDEETLLKIKQSTSSKIRFADEASPSTAPSVPGTPSAPNTDTTKVTSSSTDDLYPDVFNFGRSKIFSSTLISSLTSKDAIFKKVRDCVLTDNKDWCRQISSYIHSFWKDLHVKNGCVCFYDRIALTNSIKDTYVDAIHATHPGSLGMMDMTVHAWRSHMHRDIFIKTANCNNFLKIGKKLKTIIPSSKWAPLKLCKVSNEESKIDFGGPIYNAKNQEVYFLAFIDRFSNFPTAEVFDRANAEKFLKFLQEYVFLHKILRTIGLQ